MVAREPWSGCHNSGAANTRGTLFLAQVLKHSAEHEQGGYGSGRERVPQTPFMEFHRGLLDGAENGQGVLVNALDACTARGWSPKLRRGSRT